jgi:hypothetical protein
MSNCLISKYLCEEVYVSFCSQTKDTLLGRDRDEDYNLDDDNKQRN